MTSKKTDDEEAVIGGASHSCSFIKEAYISIYGKVFSGHSFEVEIQYGWSLEYFEFYLFIDCLD